MLCFRICSFPKVKFYSKEISNISQFFWGDKVKPVSKEKTKILELCVYRKVKWFFYKSSQNVLMRLLAQVYCDLCQRMARNGDLAEVGPLAGCPWTNCLCFARDIGERSPQKPPCLPARKQKKSARPNRSQTWTVEKSPARLGVSENGQRPSCYGKI